MFVHCRHYKVFYTHNFVCAKCNMFVGQLVWLLSKINWGAQVYFGIHLPP